MSKAERRLRSKAEHRVFKTFMFVLIVAVLVVVAAVPLQILDDYLYAHGAWKYAFQPATWGVAISSLLIAGRVVALFDRT
jgi:hypothetical protein